MLFNSMVGSYLQILLDHKIGKTTLNILILEVQCMETKIQVCKYIKICGVDEFG